MDKYSSLEGSKTYQNLVVAFAEEAKAAARYQIYAEASEYEYIKQLFEQIADNEVEHAETILRLLNGIGNDVDNLEKSVSIEKYESVVHYPSIAEVAREEGYFEIAEKLERIGGIEAHHKITFEKIEDAIASGRFKRTKQKTSWICMECGYEVLDYEPPEVCPVCGHSRDVYVPAEFFVV